MNTNGLVLNSHIGALSECIDFCRNGYRVMFTAHTDRSFVIRLKHLDNGRMLSVIADEDKYTIREGKKTIKEQQSSIRYSRMEIGYIEKVLMPLVRFL